MITHRLVIAGLLVALASAAEPIAARWTITTVAGTGEPGHAGDGGPARLAQTDGPFALAGAPDGSIWFCEYNGQRIRRLDQAGRITTVAGTGQTGYSGDGGAAREATFNRPHEIRFNAAGDCFVADMMNHAIRRIDAKSGRITTFAGNGRKGYAGDGGPAAAAMLNSPHSIQFGPDGSLFICDIGNNVIRRVDMRSGAISTFAGTGKPGATPEGAPIMGTPLRGPRSIDFDREGNLWLVTREGNQVLKLDLRAGNIRRIAGTGEKGFGGNGGPAKRATLSGPKGIAIDGEGNAWLADTESHSIRVINARTGNIELVAGTGEKGNGADGDPLQCALARPHGVFVAADGAVYIGDSESHKVRVLQRK